MHYFIEHGNLTTQASADTYGPDTGSPSDIFHITSRFQLSSQSKAFACQAGDIIVQESAQHSSLVNVILKPQWGLNIGHRSVKYFVYRGLLKSDFASGTTVATNTTEFINRFWANHADFKVKLNNNSLPDPGPEAFGLDTGISGTTLLDDIFRCSTNAKPAYVKEGEVIGNFTAQSGQKIGLEVIMSSDYLKLDINFARQAKTDVIVTGLTGLERKMKRESMLDGMDPAAFFGLHFYDGVNATTYPGGTKTVTKLKQQNLYSSLVQKFHTKNRLYVDIRSEKDRSYNFYEDYGTSGNEIKLGNQSNSSVAMDYNESSWPIKFYEQTATTSHYRTRVHVTARLDNNEEPTMFSSNKMVFDTDWNVRCFTGESTGEKNAITDGTSTTWTKEMKFYVPNTGTGSTKSNVAYVLGLNYFRGKYNTVMGAKVLKNEKYYDSAFCSIDAASLGTIGLEQQHVMGQHLNFVRQPKETDGTGNFSFVAKNGAYWDAQRVVFYAAKTDSVIRSGKKFLNTFSQKLDLDEYSFKHSKFYKDLEIACFQYQRQVGGSTETFRLPSVNHYKANDIDFKEDCLMLGLTQAQLTAVKAVTGLSSHFQRYPFLEESGTNPKTDQNSKRYFEYTLKVQGLDSSGNRSIVTPLISGNPITIFSRDNQFFCTKEFSLNQTLTNGSNEITFHIYHDGCVKVNDNLDLSLLAPTTGNDLIERIYYKYHAADGSITNICNLLTKQIDGKKKGSKVTSIPSGYTSTINHSVNVSATVSYVYPDGSVLTDGDPQYVKRRYYPNGKKDFLVYFEESLVDNNNPAPTRIDFSWNTGTNRYYFKPELAAAFIGVLLDLGTMGIGSGGCSYDNGTCWPSRSHVNGEAVDTNYKVLSSGTLAQDQTIINTMAKFGFTYILKGTSSTFATLTGATPFNYHNDHLHSGLLEINDCNTTL